jgi:hypothetical protein
MKSAGKARNNGLYRHIRTSKEIIRNLLNDSLNTMSFIWSNESHCEIYFPHCYNTFLILRDNAVPLV